MIGAFRTPTLRNLVKTGPYFHNGVSYELKEVIDFYDKGIIWTSHLANVLKDGDNPRRLKLDSDDKEGLLLFLNALEGTPVDPIVMRPTK